MALAVAQPNITQNVNITSFDRIECFYHLKLCPNYILKFRYSFGYVFVYISTMTRLVGPLGGVGHCPGYTGTYCLMAGGP
jgi:hypothetical protein